MVLQMITRYEASLEASLYTSHLVKTLDHSDHKVKQNVEPEQELWKGLDSLGQSLLPHLRWRFVLNRSWQIERELNASGFCWRSVVMCLTKVSGICSFYSWFHHHSPTPARIRSYIQSIPTIDEGISFRVRYRSKRLSTIWSISAFFSLFLISTVYWYLHLAIAVSE